MKIGLDIGSTTIKSVVLDDYENLIYHSYQRHLSQIKKHTIDLLSHIQATYVKDNEVSLAISGSAGMGLADSFDITFVQEVFATRVACNKLSPDIDTVIELGGEDAKILFLTNGLEVRMNGSCAGGTGAFIDQMATLLKLTPDQLNQSADNSTKIYPIASRCGVFAKSDIQPLINQGAKIEDISASIYYAVANQTIGGLAQGRAISGNVLYLGGPLTFSSNLRLAFDESIGTTGLFPENSLLYVSLGTAFSADKLTDLPKLLQDLNQEEEISYTFQQPLFKNQQDYDNFTARHNNAKVQTRDFESDFSDEIHIGVDAGSTTIKIVVIDCNANLLFTNYQPNLGNPIPIIKDVLIDIISNHPNAKISSVTTTGYGEELIKKAFNCDFGVVETMAHFTASKHFLPDVDFIIDIGGQDMKCFRINDGVISDIFLNEACSSGCGSFLQTFAQSLGYEVEEFAKLGLYASKPAELGSRCTVFMNSSVKQAQKDGASVENISAGLSMSVVKNAIYKVIRVSSPEQLGKKIVVQGGTFHNDAVLRAFELELGALVIRPNIAGIMGAFGAALYGCSKAGVDYTSSLISLDKLDTFTQKTNNTNCKLCPNNCELTINIFQDNNKIISGNRCQRPVTGEKALDENNLYHYKRNILQKYKPIVGTRGKIGIPMGLNMFELLPFWHTFFTQLGFAVYQSPPSSRELYLKGQATIPSDTVCYPAKLVHGHIEELSQLDLDAIFYPCMTYNFDEKFGSNHYNCPVVAYYPEVITNVKTKYINDYIGLHDSKEFVKKIHKILGKYFNGIKLNEIRNASTKAYQSYYNYLDKIRNKSQELIDIARKQQRQIIILAGRPYHIDSEINHGIDDLLTGLGATVISEDAVSHLESPSEVSVLNQWTYHARLYSCAKYCCNNKDINLVQLVSFGCGIDSITADETKEILQKSNKLYTQLKIDEITNLGAVKIRLRSLFTALERETNGLS